MKLYSYSGCSTCKKAIKFLKENGLNVSILPIRETPPTMDELNLMLNAYDGNVKKLFNVSGQDYRAMNLKDKLPNLAVSEALQLLTNNGNLVKRPFLLTDTGGYVGFNETEWRRLI